jgi:CBS domain-containing protein
MKVADAMNEHVPHIETGTPVTEAARKLARTGVADLAVVDGTGRFVGVLSEGDLLRAVLPAFSNLMDRDSLREGYDLFEEARARVSDQPIDRYLITNPITVDPSDDVTRAAGIMAARMIRRLPVVRQEKLVGTIARADICAAALVGVPTTSSA